MADIPNEIELGKETAAEAAYSGKCVAKEEWCHGAEKTFVFRHENGAHYMFSVRTTSQNGWDDDFPVTAKRVYPHEVKTIEWRTEPPEAAGIEVE